MMNSAAGSRLIKLRWWTSSVDQTALFSVDCTFLLVDVDEKSALANVDGIFCDQLLGKKFYNLNPNESNAMTLLIIILK